MNCEEQVVNRQHVLLVGSPLRPAVVTPGELRLHQLFDGQLSWLTLRASSPLRWKIDVSVEHV